MREVRILDKEICINCVHIMFPNKRVKYMIMKDWYYNDYLHDISEYTDRLEDNYTLKVIKTNEELIYTDLLNIKRTINNLIPYGSTYYLGTKKAYLKIKEN